MSIIQDALAKAGVRIERNLPEENKEHAVKTVAAIPPSTSCDIYEKKKSYNGKNINFLKIMLVLALLSFIIFYINGFLLPPNAAYRNSGTISTDEDNYAKNFNAIIPANVKSIANFGCPFNRISDPDLTKPDFHLNGIMFLESNPRAIINNILVEPEDFIEGAQVRTINRENVILDYNGAEIVLKM